MIGIPLFIIVWFIVGAVILTIKIRKGFNLKPHTPHGQAAAALGIVILWPAWFIKIKQGE